MPTTSATRPAARATDADIKKTSASPAAARTLAGVIRSPICGNPLPWSTRPPPSLDPDVREGKSERSQPEKSQEGPAVVGEHREARRRPGPLPGEPTGGRSAWAPRTRSRRGEAILALGVRPSSRGWRASRRDSQAAPPARVVRGAGRGKGPPRGGRAGAGRWRANRFHHRRRSIHVSPSSETRTSKRLRSRLNGRSGCIQTRRASIRRSPRAPGVGSGIRRTASKAIRNQPGCRPGRDRHRTRRCAGWVPSRRRAASVFEGRRASPCASLR